METEKSTQGIKEVIMNVTYTKRIQSRLKAKEIIVTLEQIRNRIAELGIEELLESHVDQVVQSLTENKVTLETEEPQSVLTPPESTFTSTPVSPNFAELYKQPEKEEIAELVYKESQELGLDLTTVDVSIITRSVKEAKSFKEDKIGTIKAALLGWVDYQASLDNESLSNAIAEVKDHATKRSLDFNNRMVGNLSEFFRSQKQSDVTSFESIIGAINSYR